MLGRRFGALGAIAVCCCLLACSKGADEGGKSANSNTGGQPPGGCASDQTLCGDTCVNTSSNPSHCGACNAACPGGSVCQAGVCSVLCGTGQLACGGVCVTIASDLGNCGACGATCNPGQFCWNGVCSDTCPGIQCNGTSGIECVDPQTNPSHCGACGSACQAGFSCVASACTLLCPGGLAACGTSCVDLASDANNCGFCGNTCGAEPCVGGQCGCTAPQTMCNGSCVDLMTDRSHCGQCDTACGDGASCASGSCVCSAGNALCANSCVNLQSSQEHCGGCNQPCSAGQVCSQGVCTSACEPGKTECNGSCVDTLTDQLHCGGCGNACPGALTCVGGECVCPAGTSACGTDCFDLTQDSQHCGDCTTACTGGQTCSAGSCACATGQKLCDGVCVSTADNLQHCGDCGVACVDEQNCSNGSCECPGEQLLCNEVCTDAQSSNEHCGECGHPCAGGQICVDGSCQCTDGMTACGELCVDTQTSNENCGACNYPCPTDRTCIAGECAGVVGDGEDGCSGEAHSIELEKLSLYQAVEVPLMEDEAEVTTANRNADVVEGRDALLRVHFTLGAEWVNREVSARLHLTTGGEERTLYRRQVVTGPSVQGNLDSTIQVPVPAEAIGLDTRWWVEVVECESSTGTVLSPRFPATGDLALGATTTGPLKIAFVPVQVNDGGTTREPDTTDAAMGPYIDYLEAMYPTTEVIASITDPVPTGSPFDITYALDDVRAKRSSDGPDDDVYYMGLIKPTATFNDYCRGMCTTGVGYVVDTMGFGAAGFRVAVAIAFASEYSAATIAHELGHNHGREHAPCGTDGDYNYPYDGGSIGVWGIDRRTDTLQDPATVTDIMGYCEPQWISDYTFQAFLDRIADLNGARSQILMSPDAAQPWRVALVSPNGPRWGHPIDNPTPPVGTPESATVVDASGQPIALVDVYVVRTSEDGHETVLVPEPESSWYAIDLGSRGVLPFTRP